MIEDFTNTVITDFLSESSSDERSRRWNISLLTFFITRNNDFDINTGLIARKVISSLLRTRKPANYKRTLYLCSVYSLSSGEYYGTWVPPDSVIYMGSRLSFTFLLKGTVNHDFTDGSVRVTPTYYGYRTYLWKAVNIYTNQESLFITVNIILHEERDFGLPNHLGNSLLYLYYSLNLYVYTLLSGRIVSPLLPNRFWRDSDIIQAIDSVEPQTIIARSRLQSFSSIVRKLPFQHWFYSADVYVRQPNLLDTVLITDKVLFYLLAFVVNTKFKYLPPEVWRSIIDKHTYERILSSFVFLVSDILQPSQIVEDVTNDTIGLSQQVYGYDKLMVLPFFVRFTDEAVHEVYSLRTDNNIQKYLSSLLPWLKFYLESDLDFSGFLSRNNSVSGIFQTVQLLASGQNPFGEPLLNWKTLTSSVNIDEE